METTFALYALGAIAGAASLPLLKARLELSRAKYPSLSGHARMARAISRLIPRYEYDDERYFRSDDAPDAIVARRRAAFLRLADLYRQRFAMTTELTRDIEEAVSDLQFTNAYRVPFQI